MWLDGPLSAMVGASTDGVSVPSSSLVLGCLFVLTLADIGCALASSIIANAIDSLTLSSIGTNAGAPIASWRDLAPTILAFSNLVSFCGPMRISKPSSAARLAFLLSLEAAIVTKKNPEVEGAF